MSTTIRANISQNSKYWIEKHRYYELKHFCLQYPIWHSAYISLNGLSQRPDVLASIGRTHMHGDSTAKCAEAKAFFSERMDLVRDAAEQADDELADYILHGVTEGVSYNTLVTRMDIPCSKDTYYDRYRKFFWILNKTRR